MTYMLKTGYQYVDIDALARCFFPTRTGERASASYAHCHTYQNFENLLYSTIYIVFLSKGPNHHLHHIFWQQTH